MTPREAGDHGTAGICLSLVLAFALFAVVQLTRTTIAAQRIDDRVDRIIVTTPEIASSLTNVPKLDETAVLSGEILTAAEPLSGHLDRVIAAGKSIDGTVLEINESAGAINASVRSINQSSTSILADVTAIRASTARIDTVTGSIRSGIVDINRRVQTIIGLADTIHGDLANVLSEVGGPAAGGFGSSNIAGHANSIDCTTAGSACER